MQLQSTINKLEEQKKSLNLKYEIREKSTAFTERLFYTLFDNNTPVEKNLNKLEKDFEELAELVCWDPNNSCKEIWTYYCKALPQILEKLNQDARAINDNDPASNSIEEVYLAYPGFYAIAIYRLSHELNKYGLPLVPRLMAECAHRLTGVDINPGAV